MEQTIPNYTAQYQGMIIYDIAKVVDAGTKYRVEYVTQSTLPWSYGDSNLKDYLPLHPTGSEIIRDILRQGKEPYIDKNWDEFTNEVLPISVTSNPTIDLITYKRRAYSFIKSFINPMMASVHASIIYGFTTLNNKFIEHGLVFSEKTRSLQIIKVMDLSEELEETNPELSQELMDDLEKYIEYKDILSRTNFIWNESEKYIEKIEKVNITGHYASPEHEEECNRNAKEQIDEIVNEFQVKINTLNNLK